MTSPVSMRSPTSTSVRPTNPSNGATTRRSLNATSAWRNAISASSRALRASVTVDSAYAPLPAERS